MTLLVLLAAAAAVPQPAALETFSDWTVGCDNGRACHAVGLIPERWPEGALTMSVRRGAGAEAPPVIAFEVAPETGAARILADGKPLGVELAADEHGAMAVAPAAAATVVAALRRANRIDLTTAGGKALGTVSLKGASAALLYMDDQQRRVGTVTALVRRGAAPAATVPPPPELPQVAAAAAAGGTRPVSLAAREVAALRKRFGCDIDEVGGPDEQEVHPLGEGTLVLLACGSGAYNVSAVPILLDGRGAAGARPAPFDAAEPWWETEGKPMLVNAAFDPATGELSSFAKARGVGDCGVGRAYAWDGSRFRLISQVDMEECRGSRDYITTWRAEVVRK